MDERGRSAAVEVDRVARPSADHHVRELEHREPRVDARAAPVACDGDQRVVGEPDGGARVALLRDVRVELLGAGAEALVVVPGSNATSPSTTSSGPACRRSPAGSSGARRARRSAGRHRR